MAQRNGGCRGIMAFTDNIMPTMALIDFAHETKSIVMYVDLIGTESIHAMIDFVYSNCKKWCVSR